MKKIQGIAGVIISIVAAVGPYTFLHVCGSGMGMEAPCKNVPIASLITAIILFVISLVSIISGFKGGFKESVNYVIDGLGIVVGVVLTGIPTFIIGVCNSAHMHCNMVTKPALIILGIILIIISAAGVLVDSKNNIQVIGKAEAVK